jgi:hypothetical protein
MHACLVRLVHVGQACALVPEYVHVSIWGKNNAVVADMASAVFVTLELSNCTGGQTPVA